MAFQEISKNSKSVASSKLEVGGNIEGFVVRIEETPSKFGGTQPNIRMQDANTGESFIVFTSGTLVYDAKEGRILPGLLTRITRKADETKKNKVGKPYTTSVFKVEQDSEVTLPGFVATQQAPLSKAETDLAEKIKGKKV